MYTASTISMQYGGIRALDGVDIEIHPGEVQALLGANGAGKSTLVKILVGAQRPSGGTLALDGQPVQFRSVLDASAHGISIVSQELNLFPDLDVLHNLFLLREPRYAGVLLNRRKMHRRARSVVDRVGLDVPMSTPVGELRLADQQLVEVARALLDEPKILFLDEPTSALQPADTQRLLDVVRRLRDSGVAIVYVSHFLEDVFAIADTITVVRNGRIVAHRQPRSELTIADALSTMLGDAAARESRPDEQAAPADHEGPGLVLTDATVSGVFGPISLTVGPGEVVGLAGLEGSGVSDVLAAVFGQLRLASGAIVMPDGSAGPTSMAAAVRAGVAYAPADRKRLGVMLDKSVTENVTMVSAGPLGLLGTLLHRGALNARAELWQKRLNIAMESPSTLVGQLSGGNQQKVVFAKWLDGDPTVVLLDDPTRGVDVGAKAEMHGIIAQMAGRGQVVLITSSDLEELATVCDRVLVLVQGRLVGEIGRAHLSEHSLLAAINTGVVAQSAA
ncbi:sugar ABC transporter ATP-binding protein [Acidothermaceae bacterium B102]|nr:sugar ABC transporter ATP-binding protein [Acidothermaceae bacterium B102]